MLKVNSIVQGLLKTLKLVDQLKSYLLYII